MKQFKAYILFIIFSGLFALYSCKYDVTEPLWYKPYDEPPTPEITSIEPAIAGPGVDYITISGVNFVNVQDSSVYFGISPTEVISATETEIVARRPSIYGDSLTVKVLPSGTLVPAKYSSFYEVDRVVFEYGDYVAGTPLDVVVTDNDNNLYVILNVPGARNIEKLTPAGEKTTLAVQARRDVSDAVISPDGLLILIADNRAMDAVDLEAETIELNWLRLSQGTFAKTGDFDVNGNFYVAGRKTPIYIADPSLNLTETTYYSEDEVWRIRVYNNALYVLVNSANPDAQTPEWAIWRHSIEANGISDKELVWDLTQSNMLDGKTISNMEISSDGIIFLSTDGDSPLLKYDLSTGEVDYAYKNILPKSITYFKWGTETSIYAAVLDSEFVDPDYAETVFHDRLFRIDMGINGAP